MAKKIYICARRIEWEDQNIIILVLNFEFGLKIASRNTEKWFEEEHRRTTTAAMMMSSELLGTGKANTKAKSKIPKACVSTYVSSLDKPSERVELDRYRSFQS